MLVKTFTSAPFTYRLPADIPITAFPDLTFNAYLTTPPRIYGEEYATPIDGAAQAAMFLNEEAAVDGYEVIYLLLQQNMVRYPGFNYRAYRFNASTGDYLGAVDAILNLVVITWAQARDASIWGVHTTVPGLPAYRYTIDPLQGPVTDGVQLYSFGTFSGVTALDAFSIDALANLLLAGVDGQSALSVYDLTTGALIRKVALSFALRQIMPEDANRCYVLTGDGTLFLVDYSVGKVLAAFRVQAPGSNPVQRMAWDRKYRRFLSWIYTPVDSTGQNTSVIAGYFPRPQAVGLTAPFPIRPPRRFRAVPVLTRTYGDMGEPVGNARIVLSADANATVGGFPALSDADGEALGSITGTAGGASTIGASTTVSP